MVEYPIELRGTSVQLCGYWPFVAASGQPLVGAPLGTHLYRRTMVCGDPLQWFLAGILSNPSAFILGQPGLGKTSLVHRIIDANAAWGAIPLVLSDSRPDYVGHIAAMGGDVITFTPGQGHLNPLDLGPSVQQLHGIKDLAERNKAVEEMRNRRRSLVEGLVQIFMGRKLASHERNALSAAINGLDPEMQTPPLIGDVLSIIQAPSERVMRLLQAKDAAHYKERVQSLSDALVLLSADGPYGDMFARPSDKHLRPGRPAVFDISGINEDDSVLGGAVQALCWNLGSAMVSAEKYLAADDGDRPRRPYLLIMDELWRIIRSGDEMVYFVDTITRLNRGRGLAQIMITHTMNDLKLSKEHLTDIAWGFVERSAMVYLGGLSSNEMGNLKSVFELTRAEQSLMEDWTAAAPIDPNTGKAGPRPGAGHFLLKTGKPVGVPFVTHFSALEYEINDTNRVWQQRNKETSHAQ